MQRFKNFPPYELVDASAVAEAAEKTRRLERLYHLTQKHSWDGKQVFGALVDKYGPPGSKMEPEVREALSRVLSILMWGELAAWNISADLALEIEDTDAKMAATAQVFDEARHFYVMRDYVLSLGPAKPLGAIPRRLLRKVLDAPTLTTKLVGMQLLFETNAVVMFRRIGESGVCPILAELMPRFERDESRHVGLGVMYLPRLVKDMSRAEAARTRMFQVECVGLLAAGGFTIREDFKTLGLNQRQMAERVTAMQDDIVNQMVEQNGKGVFRSILKKGKFAPTIINFLHPADGIENAPPVHQSVHAGLMKTVKTIDRVFA